MTKRVRCEKKTKIYIPKTVNPQIITYHPAVLKTEIISGTDGIAEQDSYKRR